MFGIPVGQDVVEIWSRFFKGRFFFSFLFFRLWGIRKLSNFIKDILICVPKMTEGLTGVEGHEGEYLMTEISFLGELTL